MLALEATAESMATTMSVFADTSNLTHSQKLLTHKNLDMTEQYVKARMGEKGKPLR